MRAKLNKKTIEKKNPINKLKNVFYMLRLLWKADKGTVIYTSYKNINEEIFYVFFFVYLTKYIYKCIANKVSFNDFIPLILIAAGIHIIIHFLAAGHAYYIKRRTPIIYKYVFEKVIKKTDEINIVQYEQPDFYDKYVRALDESIDRAMETLNTFTFFLAHSISAILALLIIIQVDYILALFIIPSLFVSLFLGYKKTNKYYNLDMENTRNKRIVAYDKRIFYEKKYASEIRLYGIKKILFGQHQKSYDKIYQVTKKYRMQTMVLKALERIAFFTFSYFGAIVYTAFVVKKGDTSNIGDYVAMITAIAFATGNLADAIERALELFKHDMYIKNLRDFLEFKGKEMEKDKIPVPSQICDIELSHIKFQYEGATKPVINDLSLSIKKGERVAFVGHNGAGKTTLVKLIMGLYDLTEGEIMVGNHNIKNYDSKEYHKHFGTVFQDLQIFALPISENVLMRKPTNQKDRDIIIDALKRAQFQDKLMELPKGIDTMITREFDEDGVVLSGGQAQKIAIARVFAKDPDIVILDEPSSALDPIAEYNMYKNMLEVTENKTVIFISHRLSSARVADKIYMLENGAIVETGTHDELMNLGEKYANMFHIQAQNYQESLPEEMGA